MTWNRETGKVVAEGGIAVVNPQGDAAYGDRIELTEVHGDITGDTVITLLVDKSEGTFDEGVYKDMGK